MKSYLGCFAILCATILSVAAEASVVAFSGEGAEKLYIESASSLGKDVYLVKFEGIESPWAGKVIKTVRENLTTANVTDSPTILNSAPVYKSATTIF